MSIDRNGCACVGVSTACPWLNIPNSHVQCEENTGVGWQFQEFGAQSALYVCEATTLWLRKLCVCECRLPGPRDPLGGELCFITQRKLLPSRTLRTLQHKELEAQIHARSRITSWPTGSLFCEISTCISGPVRVEMSRNVTKWFTNRRVMGCYLFIWNQSHNDYRLRLHPCATSLISTVSKGSLWRQALQRCHKEDKYENISAGRSDRRGRSHRSTAAQVWVKCWLSEGSGMHLLSHRVDDMYEISSNPGRQGARDHLELRAGPWVCFYHQLHDKVSTAHALRLTFI